jgi:hypothetical protein
VLVLKSVLKQRGLGDVALGGLGSWSLANMVIAHLMVRARGGAAAADGVRVLAHRYVRSSSARHEAHTLLCPRRAACVCLVRQEEDSAGGQVEHAGRMLVSFLRRFGVDWAINVDAVAVAQGGVVPRASLAEAPGKPFGGRDRLALKDPLTGVRCALRCVCVCAVCLQARVCSHGLMLMQRVPCRAVLCRAVLCCAVLCVAPQGARWRVARTATQTWRAASRTCMAPSSAKESEQREQRAAATRSPC